MKRVLIVDGDEESRQTWERELKVAGAEVDFLSEGNEALRRLENGGADLVVTDVHLPDISGLHFITEVHRKDSLLPVIVITGDNSWDMSRRIRTEGGPVFYYGLKPIEIRELEWVIEAALSWRQSRKTYWG